MYISQVRVKCRLHDHSMQVASVSCAETFRDVDAIFLNPRMRKPFRGCAHVTDDACRHTGSNRSVQHIRINLTRESINLIRSADLDSRYTPGNHYIIILP